MYARAAYDVGLAQALDALATHAPDGCAVVERTGVEYEGAPYWVITARVDAGEPLRAIRRTLLTAWFSYVASERDTAGNRLTIWERRAGFCDEP